MVDLYGGKDDAAGAAQFSRLVVTHDSLFADNPITRPTNVQSKALEALKIALERNASDTQAHTDGIRGITLQQVPDAYRGFIRTIERLFGIKIQFVRAQGLADGLKFNGLYLGDNTLYINVNSKSPYSTIIGHEFLHFLAKHNKRLYEEFS